MLMIVAAMTKTATLRWGDWLRSMIGQLSEMAGFPARSRRRAR